MTLEEQAAKLKGSLLLFTRVFYKLRTGREFEIAEPAGRESHSLTICKALVKTVRGESTRLIINCPPRYGKTEHIIEFIAWCFAKWPDCNFMYVSYSSSLAKKQTQQIRQIMNMPEFKELFECRISKETNAKDNFETEQGGSVYAVGAGGTITGRGAGIRNIERFGGSIVIDDIHKPSEVVSDTMRESVKDWYINTLHSRVNDPKKTPIIFIGQRLHEDDLPANLLLGYDGDDWDRVVIKALSDNGQALNPAMHSVEKLKQMQATMPYDFSAQYQQNPQPAGGGIFKMDWFPLREEEPKILATFITADTAETDKNYNDATVFSFWGIHKLEYKGIESEEYGLFWLDCHECRVEPKDLEPEFLSFYKDCMRYKIPPKIAAIERKSTGTYLVSMLKEMPGMRIMDVNRTRDPITQGVIGKTRRFLNIQPFIAAKQVSLPAYGKHSRNCIEHMSKITVNDTHRFDDIGDTCADAVTLALVDKVIPIVHNDSTPATDIVNQISGFNARVRNARSASTYGYRK